MAKSDIKSSGSSTGAKSQSSARSGEKTGKTAASSRHGAHASTSGGRITTVSRGSTKKGKTDWSKVDARTDVEIESAIASDPDEADFEDVDWSGATWVVPAKKVPISIRVDQEVLGFFKEEGPGYQSRINEVLKTYVRHRKKAG